MAHHEKGAKAVQEQCHGDRIDLCQDLTGVPGVLNKIDVIHILKITKVYQSIPNLAPVATYWGPHSGTTTVDVAKFNSFPQDFLAVRVCHFHQHCAKGET